MRECRDQILHKDATCEMCGIGSEELARVGKSMEICGREHYSDLVSGETFIIPFAICPACHLENHREASGRLNPCQLAAARTWTVLVEPKFGT